MKKVIGTFIILTTISLNIMAQISDSQTPFFNVTFKPGFRNNWHTHHATKGGGQMLVGVAGRGWYQEEGKPAQEILPGTVIHIPANVKHWHGAAKDSWFAHLAFEIPGENSSNEWLEPVTDEEYDMQKIAALDTAHSLFLDHHSGETTKQFMEWRAIVKPTE